MVNTKVKTVIVNRTHQELVLRVGHQNCFAKVATIAVQGEHSIEIDVNWTYQEYSLERANNVAGPAVVVVKKKKMMKLNSDDLCENESVTATEESGGNLQLHKVARGQVNVDHRPSTSMAAIWKSHFTWPKFQGRFWINSK